MSEKQLSYSPVLPNLPGWESLSKVKKEWLQQKTSDLMQAVKMETVGAIAQCLLLVDIEDGLNNEDLTFAVFVRPYVERGGNQVTIRNKLKIGRALKEKWPYTSQKLITDGGSVLEGISPVRPGDMVTIASKNPEPKDGSAKTIEGFIENTVRAKIIEQRREHRQKRNKKLSPDDSIQSKFRTWDLYEGKTKEMTSAERKKALITLTGWEMTRLITEYGVPARMLEEVTCSPIEIPEGVIAQVGFPRGQKRSKK